MEEDLNWLFGSLDAQQDLLYRVLVPGIPAQVPFPSRSTCALHNPEGDLHRVLELLGIRPRGGQRR